MPTDKFLLSSGVSFYDHKALIGDRSDDRRGVKATEKSLQHLPPSQTADCMDDPSFSFSSVRERHHDNHVQRYVPYEYSRCGLGTMAGGIRQQLKRWFVPLVPGPAASPTSLVFPRSTLSTREGGSPTDKPYLTLSSARSYHTS